MLRFFIIAALALPLWAVSPKPAQSQFLEAPVSAEILPGWRRADGLHVGAIRLVLKDGWKTYWRSPGDGGIPPQITWSGSRNLKGVTPNWPTPIVFQQSGLHSIGYQNEVVIPILITPRGNRKDIRVKARLEIGVCKDICIPETLKIQGTLPADVTQIDPTVAAAMAEQPYTAAEAQVRDVQCSFAKITDGMKISAKITMPSAGGAEFGVIETDNPMLWVAQASTRRKGNVLHVTSEVYHVEEKPFLLSRSGIRVTVLGNNYAVDIQGCSAS